MPAPFRHAASRVRRNPPLLLETNVGRVGGLASAILLGLALVPADLSVANAQPAAPTAPQIAAFGMVNHGTPACASCHGFSGEGVKVQNAPRLAGLNADYLARQLHAFKIGGKAGRDSRRMAWAVRSLSDDEIEALSDYYAAIVPISGRGDPARDDIGLGRHLADQGSWPHKVPPCASCHGADGLGVNDLSPPIAGQRADYIARELWRFRRNERRDDPLGLMRGITAHLTVEEIKAVAAYYAGLPTTPAATPPQPRAARR